MKRKVRNFGFDVKAVDEEGHFSGYASVYNVIDAYNERVAPGAFANSLRKWSTRGRLPPVLWQHRSAEPIGPFTKMVEDEKGLYVEGQLLVGEVQRATEARALMRSKTIDGMSIGFNSIVEEWNKEEMSLTLKELDLWEVSIVTFPANSESLISEVKNMFSDGRVPSLKDIEEVLRDAGFSRTQAKALVGHGYEGLLRDVEGQKTTTADGVLSELGLQLRSIDDSSSILKELLL
jgi:HK97 family phage prohead protease